MKKAIILLLALSVIVGTGFFLTQTPMLHVGATPSMTDYKFWYILRDDNGRILEAGVRYYTGAIITEIESVKRGGVFVTESVTKYRRIEHVRSFPESNKGKISSDRMGNTVRIYTMADFGDISTDDELRAFLDRELDMIAQKNNLIPISEQKIKK